MDETGQTQGSESASADVKSVIEAATAPVSAFQETLRKAFEKGVMESQAAYTRAKVAADETANALESSIVSASKGVFDLNSKALEALRANADANFDFLKAVINAKTPSEAASLQNDHARKQAEALAAQAKDFAELARKIAAESAEPIKSYVSKTFKLSA
jgi:phasin